MFVKPGDSLFDDGDYWYQKRDIDNPALLICSLPISLPIDSFAADMFVYSMNSMMTGWIIDIPAVEWHWRLRPRAFAFLPSCFA